MNTTGTDFIFFRENLTDAIMRDFNDQLEAAYLTSKRQGDLMRDREREQSPHEDRKNRYIENQIQTGVGMHDKRAHTDGGGSVDAYRPADRNYINVMESHRGKGPRNYKRSDERIKEMVCDMLCDNADLDASDIEVDVKDSVVILTGNVVDKNSKRLAEDLAGDLTGVSDVENRIRVSHHQQA
jgi:osmotically-inducible protein OsmY